MKQKKYSVDEKMAVVLVIVKCHLYPPDEFHSSIISNILHFSLTFRCFYTTYSCVFSGALHIKTINSFHSHPIGNKKV